MRKQEEPYLTGNLTAMIDVVFQLIIFFVCAVALQNNKYDETITLTLAPNGKEVIEVHPREVIIDVHKDGSVAIAKQPLNVSTLAAILKKTVSENGGSPDAVPIVLRGDEAVLHEKVQGVLDACSDAGIIKIKFAALKEKGGR
jgi:biopolymer transport protein ExbD